MASPRGRRWTEPGQRLPSGLDVFVAPQRLVIRHRFAPVRERELRIQLAGLSKELVGLFVLEQVERRDPSGEHGFGLRLGGRSRVEQRQRRAEHHRRETNVSFSLRLRDAPPRMATLELHPLPDGGDLKFTWEDGHGTSVRACVGVFVALDGLDRSGRCPAVHRRCTRCGARRQRRHSRRRGHAHQRGDEHLARGRHQRRRAVQLSRRAARHLHAEGADHAATRPTNRKGSSSARSSSSRST